MEDRIKKRNKNIILVIIILIVIIVFNVFYNTKTSYRYKYTVDDINVLEIFNKPNNYFTFELSHNNDLVVFNVDNNYSYKRGLIKSINVEEKEEDIYCYNIDGLIDFFNICKDHKTYYFNYEQDNNEEIKISNKNISIYEENKIYYFWNYKGFDYLVNGEINSINLFKDDVYNPSLIHIIDDYIFIPDYDNKHFFSDYYLIDIKTGTYTKKTLKAELSFQFEYLKIKKNKIHIYDKRQQKEFIFNYKKGKIDKILNKTYSNKQINEFKHDKNNFNYHIDLKYKIGVRNITVLKNENIKVVKSNDKKVLYLKNDTLFEFDIYKGFKKLAKNNEWTFNSDNLIYVFNK